MLAIASRTLPVVAIATLLLAACGGAAAPTPTPTKAPVAAAPTATPGAAALSTAIPTAAAPTPTRAAAATATPLPVAAAKPVPKGLLTVAVATLSEESLDVYKASGFTPKPIFMSLYDSILWRDLEGNLAPGLAESWKVLGERTFEYTLRAGLVFHNGDPLTAEDVKFSIERWLDPEVKSVRMGTFREWIDRVEALDDRRVVIHMRTPNALFHNMLPDGQAGEVVPKGYIKKVGNQKFSEAPIASGPWRFVRRARGEFLEFEANEKHYARVPHVKTVTMKIVPEATTRLAMLKVGEVDIIDQPPYRLIPDVEGKPGLRIMSTAGLWNHSLFVWDNRFTGKPLNDIRVRKALTLAIDRETVVKKVYLGYGEPAVGGVLSRGMWGYDPTLKPHPYDPEQAKQLLAEAGYPKGFALKVYATPGLDDYVEAASSYFIAIGVQAEYIKLDAGTYAGMVAGGTITGVGRIGGGGADGLGRINGLAGTGRSNWGTPVGAEFDAKLDGAIATLDDAERLRKTRALHRELYDRYYYIDVASPHTIFAVGPRVKNWPLRKGMAYLKLLEMVELAE